MNQTDELISNQRQSIVTLKAENKRLTALWEDAERRASLTNQEVRASYDNVVVESWKNALAEANAEIERLKKERDQAIAVGQMELHQAVHRSCTTYIVGNLLSIQSAHRFPELFAHLKETQS